MSLPTVSLKLVAIVPPAVRYKGEGYKVYFCPWANVYKLRPVGQGVPQGEFATLESALTEARKLAKLDAGLS